MFSIKRQRAFTLIELMVVMAILALLMSLVGPMAINSVERAKSRQEMMSVKNWLRVVSARAFNTGQAHVIKFSGKQAQLYTQNDYESESAPIIERDFESLFFQPQLLAYNKNGFVEQKLLTGTNRGQDLEINLNSWVNGVAPDEN